MFRDAGIHEAQKAGQMGVTYALDGENGVMVAFVRSSKEVYELDFSPVDVDQVCNQEKTVPLSWISQDGNDITDAYVNYVMPLIQGTAYPPMKNGMPEYLTRRQK